MPKAPALFIPHGGGPLPLMQDPAHSQLVAFLSSVASQLPRPEAILVVSAHWEEASFRIQHQAEPDLLYDYYGFPPEAYQVSYPAPGAPEVARSAAELLSNSGIDVALDEQRGFDHGVFVPLKLMYPDANIPCLQISLRADMDPAAHVALGKALAPLRDQNVMILGSGSSFHNMTAFRDGSEGLQACKAFDNWLYETCCNAPLEDAEKCLLHWEGAPEARYAHPREEHLLPLHVCFGTAVNSGQRPTHVFNGDMMGFRMSSFLWSS